MSIIWIHSKRKNSIKTVKWPTTLWDKNLRTRLCSNIAHLSKNSKSKESPLTLINSLKSNSLPLKKAKMMIEISSNPMTRWSEGDIGSKRLLTNWKNQMIRTRKSRRTKKINNRKRKSLRNQPQIRLKNRGSTRRKKCRKKRFRM